jgi:hypothetical protein
MRPEAEELPPAMVMCTSTAAVISAVPSIVPFVLGAVWFPVVALGFLVAPSLDGLRLTAASALGVAIPVLQVIALTRFFRRRGRWLLVVALLPSTAVICWFVVRAVGAGGDFAWVVLALLGPAAAPLLALAPSVGRWVAAGPAGRS